MCTAHILAIRGYYILLNPFAHLLGEIIMLIYKNQDFKFMKYPIIMELF